MLNVLIVDDEGLARKELKRLLKKVEDVTVVDEARTGKEALVMLDKYEVDVVLLDIKMPDMDGLAFAKAAPDYTRIVFCTAYSEHAAEAFELSAFDYIVKPVQFDRLESVMNKLRLTLERDGPSEVLPQDHGLLLKFGSDYKIVKISDIYRFESVGNHVAIYTDYGKTYLHMALSKVEQKLDPQHFVKASRSDIVCIGAISKLELGVSTGTFLIVLKDGSEVDVSRRQASSIRQFFSW